MRIKYEDFSLCVASVNILAASIKRRNNVQVALKNDVKFSNKIRRQTLTIKLHHCPTANICVMHLCQGERLHSASGTPNTANRSADRIVLSAPAMGSGIFAPIHPSRCPKCKYYCQSMQIIAGMEMRMKNFD